MDALAGMFKGWAIKIPNNEETTAIMMPNKKVCLNVVEILEAIAAGKIMSEVMSKTPIDLTPTTINNDVKIASKYLSSETLILRKTA